MIRYGQLCRSDSSGLGQGQTLRIARLLNPQKVMLIDSTTFNGSVQHHYWYEKYKPVIIHGFPSDSQIKEFLQNLDVVLTCETWYSNSFVDIARSMGVKTICFYNWEFMDNLANPSLPLPDKVLTPSYWHLEEMKQKFNAQYLPTPIFEDEFKQAREINLERKGKLKYLFMNGKTAIHDRNGLQSLYRALELSKGDYTVTIKSQSEIPKHPDPRLMYDFTNPEDQQELYKDFDALILPRRFGGQTLSMCEALMSGLPVIMTDIDPNNKVLPEQWLVPATKTGEFMTRTLIDIYSADTQELALTLDTFSDIRVITKRDWYYAKQQAIAISEQYEAESLRKEYEALL